MHEYLEAFPVRKVPETQLFQALGSFETLDSKLSLGTSLKFADVRTHLRKASISKVTANFLKVSRFLEIFENCLIVI